MPFNSFNKFHLTVNEELDKSGYFVCVKGAPEIVLRKCSTVLLDGKEAREQYCKTFLSLETASKTLRQLQNNDCYKGCGAVKNGLTDVGNSHLTVKNSHKAAAN